MCSDIDFIVGVKPEHFCLVQYWYAKIQESLISKAFLFFFPSSLLSASTSPTLNDLCLCAKPPPTPSSLSLLHLPQLRLPSHIFSPSFLPLLFFPSLLPASMAGYSDPLGSQTSPAQMMDTGRMGAFSGILLIFSSDTQQRCISINAATTIVIAAIQIILT